MTINLAAELNYGLGFGTDSALFSYTLLMLHVASVINKWFLFGGEAGNDALALTELFMFPTFRCWKHMLMMLLNPNRVLIKSFLLHIFIYCTHHAKLIYFHISWLYCVHNSWHFLSTSYGCGGWHDCWVDWLWDDTINSLLFVHKCAACNTTFSAACDHFDQLWLNPLCIIVIILQTWILVVFWGCNPVIHLYRFSLCKVLCTVVWALQSHGSNMGTARHQLWAFR